MASNFLTAIFLPFALFLIMFGMGLGLTINDFRQIFVAPKPIILGLMAQLLLLPLVGFALASLFPLSPELAVGVMIIAACPGGSTSNLITYLVQGNVALSVSLTALSSLMTIVTIPVVINLAATHFLDQALSFQLPVGKTILQIAVVTIIPICLGMSFHHFLPTMAAKLEKTVKWFSLFFLGVIIVGVLLKERQNLASFFLQVGGVTLTLNLLTMTLGYLLALGAGLDLPTRKSITVEVGIQNGTLAIAIATTLLNQGLRILKTSRNEVG